MVFNTKNRDELIQRIKNLEKKLQEKNEIINAFQTNSIDAFIIPESDEEQIYSLKGSDQYYKNFLENLNEAALTINFSKDIIYCNKYFADLLNQNVNDILGKPIENFITDKNINQFENLFLKSQNTKCKGEIAFKSSNHSEVLMELSFVPISKNRNSLISIIGFNYTEKKRYAKVLGLLTELPEIFAQARTIEIAYKTILQRVCPLMNWPIGHVYNFKNSTAEMMSTDIWSNINRKKYKDFINLLNDITFENGDCLPYLVLKNKKPVWIRDINENKIFLKTKLINPIKLYSAYAFPIIVDGNVISVFEFYSEKLEEKDKNFMNILNQIGLKIGSLIKQQIAEDKIIKMNLELERRVEERTAEIKKLSQALEQSSLSVIITDKDGSIIYVNKAFSQITGYQYEEAVNKTPRILKSDYSNPESYQELWNTILSGKSWKGEFLNKRKNGDYYWERTSISPLFNKNNQIINFVSVKEDITEQKKMEEELKIALDKAEIATRAKSDFLANMSHEIRTPMNAVIGLIHLLSKTGLTNKQHDYIKKIDYSAKVLLDIINDILDFSKIEAGKMDIDEVEFNINDVMENISSLINIKEQKKDIELIILVNNDVPENLKGDPLRIG
ncbi:MAG: PAS domain-containing protein, partial [Spirochaetes bacterium]|nr:PAS domain-containing protein [Spirochaetota bacterium]